MYLTSDFQHQTQNSSEQEVGLAPELNPQQLEESTQELLGKYFQLWANNNAEKISLDLHSINCKRFAAFGIVFVVGLKGCLDGVSVQALPRLRVCPGCWEQTFLGRPSPTLVFSVSLCFQVLGGRHLLEPIYFVEG